MASAATDKTVGSGSEKPKLPVKAKTIKEKHAHACELSDMESLIGKRDREIEHQIMVYCREIELLKSTLSCLSTNDEGSHPSWELLHVMAKLMHHNAEEVDCVMMNLFHKLQRLGLINDVVRCVNYLCCVQTTHCQSFSRRWS